MSGIKTVTHDGQVYQIGQIYAFSDEGSLWVVDCLRVIAGNDDHPFKARSSWKLARKALLSDLGTITPAPIELDHGKAYTFDYHRFKAPFIGVYNKAGNTFITAEDDYFVFDCKNIRLMAIVEGGKS